MESMIIIVHVVVAIVITGLVLLQQGKGADMGASFGSGASQTLFGSTGSGNALTKFTSWMAVIFFATSLGLAMLARQQAGATVEQSSLIENLDQLEAQRAAQPAGDLPQAPFDAAASDMPLAGEEAGAVDTDIEDAAEAALDAAESTDAPLASDDNETQ
jgi:preprotein translocase subunit SecG